MLRNMIKYAVLGMSLLGVSHSVLAFKLDTHVWVGSQVIEDLKEGDGKVTIPPFGEFDVDSDIVTAITTRPKSYLYGNIGPDFFPDVIAGQTATHPGVEGGWKSDEWFAHLLNQRESASASELAFTMGYIAHGATDFWAHTYVNHYSGDVFDLTDLEIETEKRHYLIEGYIDHYVPDVIKNNSANVGRGIDVLNSYDGDFPTGFVADNLISHPDIRDIYKTKAPHLALMSTLKEKIPEWTNLVDGHRNKYYKIIGDIVEDLMPELENGFQDVRHFEEEMCKAPADFDRVLRGEEFPDVGGALEDLTNAINGTEEEIIRADDKLFAIAQRLNDFSDVAAAHEVLNSTQQNLFSAKQNLESQLLGLDQDIRAKGCKLLEETFISPEGLYSFAVNELPFGEELNDLLTHTLDPTGVLNLSPSNVLDPGGLIGGLMGGGSSSPPQPPRIDTERGDRAYFQAKIDANIENVIDPVLVAGGVQYYRDLLEAAEQSGSQFEIDFYSQILNNYAQADWQNRLYERTIENLPDGVDITIITSRNGRYSGHSTPSGSWLCSEVNGFIDATMTGALNLTHSLENSVLSSQSDVLSAATDLHNKSNQAIADIRNVGLGIIEQTQETHAYFSRRVGNAVEEYAMQNIAFAQQITTATDPLEINKYTDRIRENLSTMLIELCEDQGKMHAYLDRGIIEGAPFFIAYWVDRLAKAYQGDYDIYEFEDGNFLSTLSQSFPFEDGSVNFDEGTLSVSFELTDGDSSMDVYTEYLYFYLKTWDQGINKAITHYQETNREVVDVVLTPGLDQQNIIQDKLKDWLICSGPMVIGMSPFAAENICLIGLEVENLIDAFVEVKEIHDELILQVGIPPELQNLKQELDDALRDVKDQIKADIIARSPELQFLEWVQNGNDSDPSMINTIFAETTQNNLVFDFESDPFSERLNAELKVSDGHYNPDDFSPVYNSVILSKLSLLSASELNRLVTIAGGHSGTYGPELFEEIPGKSFNILIGGVRTMDGNHQWLKETPPALKSFAPYPVIAANKSYTHAHEDGYRDKGFRLFQDPLARTNVFLKVFKGPVNASIEDASTYGFKDLIPSDYPYQTCAGMPFPSEMDSQACIAGWLIPVLFTLM